MAPCPGSAKYWLVSAQVLALRSQPRVWGSCVLLAQDSFSGDNFSQAEHN